MEQIGTSSQQEAHCKQEKKHNMKKILFLLLFPCLALAQYPGNAGQKITLGEQTTADGLVYRGLAADTTRKPSVDTMAFILLDTNTNIIWQYKKAVNNAWTRVGGSISSGVTGVLPEANGGTGSETKNFVDLTTIQSIEGEKTFISNNFNLKAVGAFPGTTSRTSYIFRDVDNNSRGSFGFTASNTNRLSLNNNKVSQMVFVVNSSITNGVIMRLDTNFRVMINGDLAPSQTLDVNGNARIRSVAAGTFSYNLNITSDGTLTTATSDEKYKYNILPISYGLNTILQLKPVNFQWVEGEENDLGFIAQDVADIIPEAVDTNWNSDLLMRYESIIPILTKAIQEQNVLIKALEQRIINLENK